MRAVIRGAWLVLFLATMACSGRPAPDTAGMVRYADARWWAGSDFETGDRVVRDGVFVEDPGVSVDSTVAMGGAWVTPAFGEAHNHNVEGGYPGGIEAVIEGYLERGILYVKNPNIIPRSRAEAEAHVNGPGTIDATFANGGLTVTDGHPYAMAQRNIRLNPNWTDADGEGAFYHTIDELSDLRSKWDAIVAGDPDFIKTYLLYSEEYEERRDSEDAYAWKGLNPAILDSIVVRAHEAGLRVSTHVETAADFTAAVAAGVDEINHMPGFRPQQGVPMDRYRISPEAARQAGEQGTRVVATIGRSLPAPDDFDAPENAAFHDLHRANLRTLKDAGVTVVLGSDRYRGFPDQEVRYLAYLGVYAMPELLEIWGRHTPKAIFPDRQIGRLAPGYEANFVVFPDEPFEDLGDPAAIRAVYKRGMPVHGDVMPRG